MLISYIRHKVITPISKVQRLLKLLDIIEDLDIKKVNGNVHITISDTVIVNSLKDILLYSREGKLITSHSRTHINPDIKIIVTDDTDTNDISKRSIERKQFLLNQVEANRCTDECCKQ